MQRFTAKTKVAIAAFAVCFLLICVSQTGWNPQFMHTGLVRKEAKKVVSSRNKTVSRGGQTPGTTPRKPAVYSLQPRLCLLGKSNPETVLFVSSRPSSLDMRAAIRETWGYTAASCGIKVIFGFGRQHNITVQKAFQVESLLHGDILQDNSIGDSYHNQTALILSFFSWGAQHCHTEYMAKADDDVWLTFSILAPFVRSIKFTRFVTGLEFPPGSSVLRDSNHQQSLSKAEHPSDFYTSYMSGVLYVFPAHLIPHILQTAKGMKNYWIDDAFITGDVVDAMNKGLQELSPEYVHRVNMNIIHKVPENITMPADCVPLNRVTQHKIDPATKRTINNYPCAEKLKTCL